MSSSQKKKPSGSSGRSNNQSQHRMNGPTTGYEPPTKRQQNTGLLVTLGIVIIVALFFNSNKGSRAIDYKVSENYLTVTGPSDTGFSTDIPWLDIVSVEVADTLDIGESISSTVSQEYEDCLCGTFKNDLYGTYTLCISKNISKFIVLKTNDGILVFNFNDANTTVGLCDGILTYLDEHVYN